MKRKLLYLAALVCAALVAVGATITTWNPYQAGQTAGSLVTDGNRSYRVVMIESGLTHPTHSDGLVNRGDACVLGTTGLVGVAIESATTSAQYLVIDTEGIWNLTVRAVGAMSIGDEVYINTSTCELTNNPNGGQLFGRIMTALSAASSGVRAVQVHGGPTDGLAMDNGEAITNPSDGVTRTTFDDDAVELGDEQTYSTNTSTSANDYFRRSWWFEDSASGMTEGGYFDWVWTDVTTATEDTRLDFGGMTAGTLADWLHLTGAALYPEADGGLTLGLDGQGFGNVFINGNTVTTGSLRVGANGTAITQSRDGQATILSGATSAVVTLATIDADDVVVVTAMENISTGTVYVQIEVGYGFDICIVDMTQGTADLAASDYTFSWHVRED